jgi:hypothetical protein
VVVSPVSFSFSLLLLLLLLLVVDVSVDGFNTASRQRFKRTARSFGGLVLLLLLGSVVVGTLLFTSGFEFELEASWEAKETDRDRDIDVVGESDDHRRKVVETRIPGMAVPVVGSERAALDNGGDVFFVVAVGW